MKNKIIVLILMLLPALLQAQTARDYYFKALAQNEYKNFDSALFYVNKAIQFKQNQEQILKLRAELYLKLKKAPLALKDFEKLDGLNKENQKLNIARCYAETGQAKEAIQMIELYLQSPKKGRLSYLRTLPEFESLKQNDAWIELFKKDWYTKSALNLEEAQYLITNKDWDDALLILDKYIDKHKRNDEARFLRAKCYYGTSDYKLASKNIKSALKMDNGRAEYHALASKIYMASKQIDKAIESINSCLKIDSWNPEYILLAARVYYAAFENSRSIEFLMDYTAAFNKNQEALYLLASNYFETNQYTKADRIIQDLLKQNQASADYFFLSGNILFAQERLSEAVNSYSMALDLNPKDHRIYFNRGQALIDMGNKKEGCLDLRKAFQLNYNPAYEAFKKRCER